MAKIKAIETRVFIKDNPGKSASGISKPALNIKVDVRQDFVTDFSINQIEGGMDAWIEQMLSTGRVIIPAGIKFDGGAWISSKLTVNGDKQATGGLDNPYNPNAVNVSSEGVVAEPQLVAA